MNLRELILGLAATTEAEVLALWGRYQAGEITEDVFVTATAAMIDRANARATVAADVAIAGAVGAQLGRRVLPTGLAVSSDQSRLRQAVTTVLRDEVVTATTPAELAGSRAARLGRLARAEPAGSAQDAAVTAMRRHPVAGWTRGVSGKACPVCRRWADGKVRPATVPMLRHPGCSCVPQPVVTR